MYDQVGKLGAGLFVGQSGQVAAVQFTQGRLYNGGDLDAVSNQGSRFPGPAQRACVKGLDVGITLESSAQEKGLTSAQGGEGNVCPPAQEPTVFALYGLTVAGQDEIGCHSG